MDNTQISTSDNMQIVTVSEAYASYSKYIDAAPRTVQTYTANTRQFMKWLTEKGIQTPRREDVITYRDELKARCKPSTVQSYITSLKLFFSWTEQTGIYPNIAKHIKGAKLDTSHKKDYLTSAQIKDILESIPTESARGKRDYSIIALMATGGLRDIEVSRANIEDIRQLGKDTVLYLQGKGHEERTDFIKIVPEVEKMIREYLRTRRNARPESPLFASLSNNSKGERLTTKSISQLVKRRFVDAGYNSERLTAHSLRHSAVTIPLLDGIPLEEVQQFARHKNISTTQIYAHNLDRTKNRSETTIAKSIFTKGE